MAVIIFCGEVNSLSRVTVSRLLLSFSWGSVRAYIGPERALRYFSRVWWGVLTREFWRGLPKFLEMFFANSALKVSPWVVGRSFFSSNFRSSCGILSPNLYRISVVLMFWVSCFRSDLFIRFVARIRPLGQFLTACSTLRWALFAFMFALYKRR